MSFWCLFLDSHLITYPHINEVHVASKNSHTTFTAWAQHSLKRRESVCIIDIFNRLLLADVAIIRSFNCRGLEYCYFWFRTVYLNSCLDLSGEGNWCWWSFGCDLVTFWWGLAWERRFAFLVNVSWNVVVIICACVEYCILSGFIEIHILKINKKSKFICKIWGRFER